MPEPSYAHVTSRVESGALVLTLTDTQVRGDELAGELGIPLGPRIGELLVELAEAQYAGELSTREQSIAYGRRLVAGGERPPQR